MTFLLALLLTLPAWAESLRVATFNTELARRGPGVLLRDILKGADPQINAVIRQLQLADADIIALQGFDYDYEGRALQAFADALAQQGAPYLYHYSAPPNAGLMTKQDINQDGEFGGPRDAQGYGRFFGQGAMAILSRYPILAGDVRDFSTLLWRDLPENLYPLTQTGPWGGETIHAIQRLSSHGHWVVPIQHPTFGIVQILTCYATPPLFDGPEDRNGRRNHDEVAFWGHYLDGAFPPPPDESFVLMGDFNLDPNKGDGRRAAIQSLLADTRLQDPLPEQPTVHWENTGEMRVDYVLPSADWRIDTAKILAVDPDASRHRLVWVDLAR